ncbi:MAG: flagellar motor switch protein FliN [Planctomycetes bacterium]|nr:flagellar motor switch protein FliN [Planctomycetota bacterium]
MIADELNQDDIDALLGGLTGGDDSSSDDALSALSDDNGGSSSSAMPARGEDNVDLPEFEEESDEEAGQKLEELLSNIKLKAKIRLGRAEMLVEDILKLKPGKVVQLDRMSGDPVDLMVGDRVVAKGEVIILNEAFCIRITEIFPIREKLERQQN